MKRRILILLIATITFSGCGKKGDDSGSPSAATPEKTTLIFPSQNSACTTATVISDNQSNITFTWTAAPNAESYDVVIKDLSSAVSSTKSVTGTQLTVTLGRSNAYSWYVVSKSSKNATTAQSDTWKFFNPGPGTVYYAPFPAELLTPTFNGTATISSGKITLTWQGSDPDNDIVNYNVYLGTSSTNLTMVQAVYINNAVISAGTSGTKYYWKVVTIDRQGNTSDSPVYYFTAY